MDMWIDIHTRYTINATNKIKKSCAWIRWFRNIHKGSSLMKKLMMQKTFYIQIELLEKILFIVNPKFPIHSFYCKRLFQHAF